MSLQRGLVLTSAQFAALDRVPEDCKVVMAAEESPVLQRPDGRLLRITPLGRIVNASGWMVEDLDLRAIELACPRRQPAG